MITIFHYEPDKKFYLGREMIPDRPHGSGLPAHSTDIPPPLDSLPDGMIPIFDGVSWHIVPDNFWRPEYVEINYDAGRHTSTYQPISISMYSKHFPMYPSMPQLCNSLLVRDGIIQRTRLIHKKFEHLFKLHKKALRCDIFSVPLDSPKFTELHSSPTHIYEYKLEAENIIYLMRRVLDSLVQLSYLLTNYQDFDASKIISYNEIGKFTDNSMINTEIGKIILGDNNEYLSDNTEFLSIINDLFNSYKHSLMHDETFHRLSDAVPTFISYQAKRNNHTNIIQYHNHNAYHIIMGFQDTLLRILKNQNIYFKESSGLE